MAFLDVPNTARWAAERGPAAIITDLTNALERDFSRWQELDISPRYASHSREGVIELMPAADSETFGFKLVNGHPANPARGFQTVTACGMLVEVSNGYPSFLAEMTLLTALRTAATSALAARWLHSHDLISAGEAEGRGVHAMIGTGAQSEFQALAFRGELGIDRLRVFDVDPAATAKFAANAATLGFTDVTVADSPAEAVRGADVITTCTADKRLATVLHDADLATANPDTLYINAIGGDCPGKTELEPAIMERAHLVVVEHEEQSRVEGELQLQPATFPVTELHEIIRGLAPQPAPHTLTIFDSVGFGVEDFCTLRYARKSLTGTDFLQQIDLIANPDDPKNLFSLVAPR